MMPARVAPDFGRGVATWLQVGLPLSGPRLRLARGGPGSVQTADTGPSVMLGQFPLRHARLMPVHPRLGKLRSGLRFANFNEVRPHRDASARVRIAMLAVSMLAH